MNITIDDTSPLLQYRSVTGSSWLTNHTNDDQTPNYYEQTFHSTFGNGDSMSFNFNASAIYVFGAYRENHGLYSTQLDGGNLGYTFGYSQTSKFQYPLFVSKGLDLNVEHNLVITNLPTQSNPPATAENPLYLDIDYIVLTLPDPGKKVYTTTYDDFSPAFSYQGFQGATNFGKDWFNGTAHTTSNNSDIASFSFNGSSVQIFGGINYNHANYSVSLDGGLNRLYNGSALTLTQNATIFLATNLTDGPHTVSLSNAGAGKLFSIDWAVTNSSISPDMGTNSTNTTTTGSSDTGNQSSSGSSSHTGAIAGGVVGGVAALVILAFLLWFFCIRKKRTRGSGKAYDPVDLNGGPNTTLDGAEVAPFPSSTAAAYGSSAHRTGSLLSDPNTQSMSQTQNHNTPFLTTIPPPPPSNATSYPRSVATSPSQYNPSSSNPYEALVAAGGTGTTGSSSGPTESGQSNAYTTTDQSQVNSPPLGSPTPGSGAKSLGVPLPFTSVPVPRPEVGEQRRSVLGRADDYGPLPLSPSEQGHDDELLPPDYQQATEALPGQKPAR